MNKRIWELDMLRGVCMIGIMFFHLVYDLVYLYGVMELSTPLALTLFQLGNDWAGTPFLLISGLCATLGSKPVKRGLTVIAGGLAINLVTACMYFFGFADKSIIIYFGVLHCIGTCMLLWPLLRKLPTTALWVFGIMMAAVGLYLRNGVYVEFPWLIPLGFVTRSFASSDYFPLLPNLGYFLIGAAAGRIFYAEKRSLLPNVNARNVIIRFFSFFGKHSLIIYLLHQPILAGLVGLWVALA